MKLIECPHCAMKYRLDPAKFSQPRLRIRCKKCENVFEADLSAEDAPATPPPPQPGGAPEAAPTAAPAAPTGSAGSGVQILAAHGQAEILEEMRQLLGEAGHEVITADNGVDALSIIQKQRPRVAILDVALPTVFGFEICEIVRRDDDFSNVGLILVAAIYDQSRYKRPPATLYGADDYIERHEIAAGLVSKVAAVLAGEAAAPAAAPSAPAPAPAAPTPAAPSAPEERPTEPPPAATPPAALPPIPDFATGLSEDEVSRCRRLARTILSDIALYNAEKVDEGLRGDFRAILKDELSDGQQVLAERLSAIVSDPAPFLEEAIDQYVAGKRKELGLDG